MYKHAEKYHLLKEENAQLHIQVKAMDAVAYLPDYLMDEVFEQDGEVLSQDLYEFRPAVLYMEQLLRMYPREITAKWQIIPAFEETLMRIDEARNNEIQGN